MKRSVESIVRSAIMFSTVSEEADFASGFLVRRDGVFGSAGVAARGLSAMPPKSGGAIGVAARDLFEAGVSPRFGSTTAWSDCQPLSGWHTHSGFAVGRRR